MPNNIEISSTDWIYIVSAGLNIFIAFYVYFSDRKEVNKRFFWLFNWITAWIVTLYFFYAITDPGAVLLLGRLNFAIALLIVSSFLEFANIFPQGKSYVKAKYVELIKILSVLFFFVTLLTPFVAEQELIIGSERETVFGVLFIPYAVYTVSVMLFSLSILVRKYHFARGLDRLRLRYVFFGFLVATCIGLFTNLFLPLVFKIYTLQEFGPISTILLALIISYSIVQYRLFDIRFVLGKTVELLVLIFFPFIFFYGALFVQDALWGTVYSIGAYITGFFLSLLFVFSFGFLRRWFSESFITKFIYSGKDYNQLKNAFIAVIGNELRLEIIIENMKKVLNQAFEGAQLSIIIYKDEDLTDLVYGDIPLGKDIEMVFRESFVGSKTTITKDELLVGRYEELINESNSELLIAFVNKNNIDMISLTRNKDYTAVILIGEPRVGEAYASEDISFIQDIISSFIVGAGRSLLYFEVSSFNKTLQEKIDHATAELQKRINELNEIRAKERDMMDIMGHELRTPLSIIKISLGALDMHAEKHPETFGPQAYLAYQERLRDAIAREIKLLETMLTSTKIDAARIEIVRERVNIVNVINDAILSQKEKAHDKGVEVRVENLPKEVFVYGDKVRLGEVVDNLVSNAVKYTEKGEVIVKIEDSDKEMVKVSIIDTGPGIPKEALPRLGEKFFRVGQYLGRQRANGSSASPASPDIVRPGGTGLGLYVTFGLVKLMGGKLTVESDVGKGSNFSFTVPRYVNQTEDISHGDDKDLFNRLGLAKVADGKVVEVARDPASSATPDSIEEVDQLSS